ncbi:MAG TPA: hypothetical protein VI076_07175 [Actinopolymorphaceae bacterium]
MEADIPTARELATSFLSAQHPLTRRSADDAGRLEALTDQCADDVLLATSLQIAELRARRFAPGTPAEAFLNRWSHVRDDLAAMMSMRYEGLDPTKPFVDATVTSRPFTADDLPALARAASGIYGTLGPRDLRVWSAAPAGHVDRTRPDERFLAAPVSAVRAGFEVPVRPNSASRWHGRSSTTRRRGRRTTRWIAHIRRTLSKRHSPVARIWRRVSRTATCSMSRSTAHEPAPSR